MEDKIKAKAQEVRLALLGEVHKQIDGAVSEGNSADRLRALQELAGILNQLDPSAGAGSYGFSRPVSSVPELKPGDAVRVDGHDMKVERFAVSYLPQIPGQMGDDASRRRIRLDLIP